jgi:hypothetical protein
MHAFLTVRKLKPGTYDEWRKAWEPEEWPEGSKRAYILRNLEDPDEVIAFGFYEGELDVMRREPKFAETQRARFEKMAPFVDSTGADGVYEVVEEVVPSKTTAGVGSTRA